MWMMQQSLRGFYNSYRIHIFMCTVYIRICIYICSFVHIQIQAGKWSIGLWGCAAVSLSLSLKVNKPTTAVRECYEEVPIGSKN